jgi:hypothetical protein
MEKKRMKETEEGHENGRERTVDSVKIERPARRRRNPSTAVFATNA